MECLDSKEELEDNSYLCCIFRVTLRHVCQQDSDEDFLSESEETDSSEGCSPAVTIFEFKSVQEETSLDGYVRLIVCILAFPSKPQLTEMVMRADHAR